MDNYFLPSILNITGTLSVGGVNGLSQLEVQMGYMREFNEPNFNQTFDVFAHSGPEANFPAITTATGTN